jgi:hypothetical protein
LVRRWRYPASRRAGGARQATLGIRQTSGESQLPWDIRQTLSGESGAPGQIWQKLSVESLPALPASGEILDWQDNAYMMRLRRELSFSHLLELSRVSDPVALAFFAFLMRSSA